MAMPLTELLGRIELRHLRYFIAVADAGSISAAAQRLHLSQPPLSVQIKELESTVGIELFARHRKGITLTEAGAVMLEEARLVVDQAGRALQRVRQVGRGEMGEVRLGVLTSLMWCGLPHYFKAFQQRFPGVKWTLVELSPAEQAVALHERRIDVGFWRIDMTLSAGLRSELLSRDKPVAVLPASHALARRRAVRLADLHQLPYMSVGPQQSNFINDMLEAMRAHGHRFVVSRMASDPQVLLALVGTGMGFTLLAGSFANVPWPGVVFRPLVEEFPSLDLYLFVRDQHLSPAVTRFVEVALEVSAETRQVDRPG